MNKIIIIIICLIHILNAQAQTDSMKLSLDKAIEFALKNRNELKIQQNTVDISRNEVKKINSRFLPQLTSDIDVRYNNKLQTNILPGIIFGDGEPDRVLQFGTSYNSLISINLTLPVFNPNDIGDKKIAKSQIKYDELNIKKNEIDIRQEVTEGYFVALMWKEKKLLSETNLSRTKSICDMALEQNKQGVITSHDLLHFQVDYENALSDDIQNKNNLQLSINDLLYKMGIDSALNLILTDNLGLLYTQFSHISTGSQENKRIELDMEEVKSEIIHHNKKKQSLLYLPTVSIYGNYVTQYMDNAFNPISSAHWYPYNYAGIKASIPLFDGMSKLRTKMTYELQYKSSQLKLDKLNKDYKQEALNAITALQNAQTDLDNQKKNLVLTENLYTIDTDRFKNGAIKQNDLTTSYYSLQQSQVHYLNAIYNYLVALVKYKKAMGSL